MHAKAKQVIAITGSILLVSLLLFAFSWFYVRGSELSFLQDLPSDCEASVTISSWDGDSQKKVLSRNQLSQIL